MRARLLLAIVLGAAACGGTEPQDRSDGAGATTREAVPASLSTPGVRGDSGSTPPQLRVCADPNNLPFSNERQEGFENRLAEIVAREMNAEVHYTWWAQRRGFLRHTLNAGACDLVMGLPADAEGVLTTRPYYASTYVFVSRRDRHLTVNTFDDPALRRLRIGVQLVGDDGANPPPAHALSRRGIVRNVVGYSVYGDYSEESPPSAVVKAVAKGEVDIAAAWGPLAGYFATRQAVPLDVVPVATERDSPTLPFVFAIAMGVRRGDTAFRDRLDAIIDVRADEIRALLTSFGVPLVHGTASSPEQDARELSARERQEGAR